MSSTWLLHLLKCPESPGQQALLLRLEISSHTFHPCIALKKFYMLDFAVQSLHHVARSVRTLQLITADSLRHTAARPKLKGIETGRPLLFNSEQVALSGQACSPAQRCLCTNHGQRSGMSQLGPQSPQALQLLVATGSAKSRSFPCSTTTTTTTWKGLSVPSLGCISAALKISLSRTSLLIPQNLPEGLGQQPVTHAAQCTH